ncbi:MAG: bifunctional tetrahydrofolate synthase/dihydrofolate synthase, partial [Oscillospiraceae bacterium]|nr:bifunctional tetrahydrofolate synthase/dihydrofolate synthase [Oscillospiraceae bacterium]
SMIGLHQINNAVTAIEACRYLRDEKKFDISENNIKESLENSKVMARVQYIEGNPSVIVDGGHNPSGITMLSYELHYVKHILHKKIFTVIGMIDSKDYRQGAEIISKYSEKIFCVDGFAENCVNPEVLVGIASKYTDALSCNLEDAVKNARNLAIENNDIVLICGSLYLASSYLNNFE